MRQIHINEAAMPLIIEYHHAMDDGLYKLADEIANHLVDNAERYEEILRKRMSPELYTKWFGTENNDNVIDGVAVTVTGGTVSFAEPTKKSIYVSINDVESRDVRRIASIVYHEIGHCVNVAKADSVSQGMKDFESPLFLDIKYGEYQRLLNEIYRFYTRELKARCFEATMWLRKSREVPSLEEYYGHRCTGISSMRAFINELEGMSEDDKIIDRIYVNMTRDFSHPPFEKQRKVVLGFFKGQFSKFKRKVDKIYCDYVQSKKEQH